MVQLYTYMVRSRAFEEMAISRVYAAKIPATWMSGIGQEGIVGAVGQLRPDDYITYTHRGAYCFICRGTDPRELLAELYGKRTGCCRARAAGTSPTCSTACSAERDHRRPPLSP
jgi:TPP-dependent pyruvate/acetoin dehydrogenase alpha subunit